MTLPDGFESALSGLLSSPEQLGRIVELAQSLSGGSPSEETPPTASPLPSLPDELSDPRFLGLLGKILAAYRSAGDKDALVSAMEPFLKEDRRRVLRKALMAAKLTKAARAALGEMGGDWFV